MKKIIIFGTGGNCIDILDTILDINNNSKRTIYEFKGFLDDNSKTWGNEYFGFKVLGPLCKAINYKDCFFVNGIGSVKNYWKKNKIIKETNLPLDRFERIIHPSASVSRMSSIGYGSVILQNATVASNVKIGNHVIILPSSVISHDDIISDHTCITGGVCISGKVIIGNSCYIGTNASIISNIKIGDYCLIGMGSVVLNNIPDCSVAIGNPVKILKQVQFTY